MKRNPYWLTLISWLALGAALAPAATPVEKLTFSGEVDTNQASFILTGKLRGGGAPEEGEPRLIYAAAIHSRVQWEKTSVVQRAELRATVLQGRFKEWVLAMRGDGEVEKVTSPLLKDWAVRFDGQGRKHLVLRPVEAATNLPPAREWTVTVEARHPFRELPLEFTPLLFQPQEAAFTEGTLELQPGETLELSLTNLTGVMLVHRAPQGGTTPPALTSSQPYLLRWTGADYGLLVRAQERDAEGRQARWEQFQLAGRLGDQQALFTLRGQAVVPHPEGGTLPVLAGEAALTRLPTNAEVIYADGRHLLLFRRPGTYPLELEFAARVRPSNEWNTVQFEVVSSPLRPVRLEGLPADTVFAPGSAARPEHQGDQFLTFLPSTGPVRWQWKSAKKEEVGKLFFAVDGTVYMNLGPGLLRQACWFDYKVMQGELRQLTLELTGDGEVTRVRGDHILAWRLEPGTNGTRRLVVQLNQPCRDSYQLQVLLQAPLGGFPLTVVPPRLVPVQAIRYAGHLAAVNDGAVRLETTDTRGLSQISPELFPRRKELADAGLVAGTQMFAYRFSGADYGLTLQASQVLPEITVSQLLLYHLGETETTIESELELEIREAPLREFTVRVPADYANPRVSAQQLSDFFLTPEANSPFARLRLVFSQPQTGRQVVQIRLGKNTNAVAGLWPLPAVQPLGIKSLRLHVGVSADTGFRLTAGEVTGLTELAPGFFPRKIANLQLAWRLREESWQAAVNIERLAQVVLADAVHLYTLKEGIAYGSSVIHYWVGGAPVNQFRVAVPANYGNVEFAGRDVRNWKRTADGYEVYLNTPAYGAFTLLVTCDRQFHTRTNNVVDFAGARPLDAQSEQGSVLLVSEHPFDFRPVEISPHLLQLDPREIPPEHRLLFDAPLLAAYQYTARPFTLRLALTSLPPGETMRQVADRAVLQTRITQEGELATTARYFVKNQGYAHLRVKIPPGYKLWEVRVDEQTAAPVTDGAFTLIPLPPRADPTAILKVDLKLATRSPDKRRLHLATPALLAPVLQTEWRLQPDPQHRLRFRQGGAVPVGPSAGNTGWDWLRRLLRGELSVWDSRLALYAVPLSLLLAAAAFRRAGRPGQYRWSRGNLLALAGGLLATAAALLSLAALAGQAWLHGAAVPADLTFIAPIQNPGQALAVEVDNVPVTGLGYWLEASWPALLALLLWLALKVRQVSGALRSFGVALGWTLLSWAALRAPNGGMLFFMVLALFIIIHLLVPALRQQARLPLAPAAPAPDPTPATPSAAGPAAALWIIGLCLSLPVGAAEPPKSMVQSVVQTVQVREGSAHGRVQLVWLCEEGQRLDFLHGPAVLTRIEYPRESLTLSELRAGGPGACRLTARAAGRYVLEFDYQLALPAESGSGGLTLPTAGGVVNRLTLELEAADMEVFSAEAVSVATVAAQRDGRVISRAEVILPPRTGVAIGWRPRARDPRREAAVFYGELHHLYIPTAGVLEGLHWVQVKPAQGQLLEVAFSVPTNQTITDVRGENVAHWRFDPDRRHLRVVLDAPQARPFYLWLHSQIPAGTLPYEQTAAVPALSGAAGQWGMVGLATGGEVQLLDTLKSQGLSPVNLEDFPASVVTEAAKPMPGLTLRRAYRYSAVEARLTLAATAVEPDIRVVSQETHSLGEDRSLLAIQWTVDITRAGIFRLSFALPNDFDLESLSGTALSHWTQARAGGERVVTVHLRGKTEGRQTFNLTLAGPGLARKTEWVAPCVVVREAARQSGQLVLVPEQGVRLHVRDREGVTPLDPRKAGLSQKGMLAFTLHQSRWRMVFDVETVEPWVEASFLQSCSLREGQALVWVNFDYRIDNAGVKSLWVQVPTNAENVRFEGDLLSDAVRQPAAPDAAWQNWEVKLQRRVLGNYPLRLSYQWPVTHQAAEVKIVSVRARHVNLERGYLAVQSGGRLQLRIPSLPPALKPVEWPAIPASLRRGRELTESKDCFVILENDVALTVALSRHEVTPLLPAQVERLTLTSVIAPTGQMLTEGRLQLRPGDKRLLRMKLPPGSRFWYAFINDQSAWPWREGEQILLLLEKHTEPNQPTTVDFFYTMPTSEQAMRSGSLAVAGPSFDLPLENVNWHVYVPANWDVKGWQSVFQLQGQGPTVWPDSINVDAYLQTETARRQEKLKTAENLLNMGNALLQSGAPQKAQRAFQSAWNLSPQDAAFNEDARVQWHNVRLQQTLLGLNERRNAAFETGERRDGRLRRTITQSAPGQAPQYTQQEAQQMLERNAPDENAALMRLAERLLRQQMAGATKPEGIRAAIPVQGRPYQFTGSLVVDEWADLKVQLQVKPEDRRPFFGTLGSLAALLLFLLLLAGLVRQPAAASRAGDSL